jgi:CRISPR-associated endoribonuclease Cas6
LHTTRYPMKQVRLPAFQGRISIETRLPAPMMALWTTLYSFAPYAGIGVKTTLGMGGVSMMKASNLPV